MFAAGSAFHLFQGDPEFRCRLEAFHLLLGRCLPDNFPDILLLYLLQRHFLVKLHIQHLMRSSIKRKMSGNQLEQQDTYRIDIRRLVLMHHIPHHKLRSRIGGFSHKLSGSGQHLVLRIQRRQLFCDAEINDLHFSVCRYHDVAGVYVPVYVPFIVQRHDAGQHIPDDKQSKVQPVVEVLIIQFLGELHFLAFIVGCFSFQQIEQHHSFQQFTHDMVTLMDDFGGHPLVYLNEAEHLHQIFIMNLDGRFSSRTFYHVLGQVIEQELNGDIHTDPFRVNTLAPEDLSHSTYSQRFAFGIYFINNAVFNLIDSLYSYNRHKFFI